MSVGIQQLMTVIETRVYVRTFRAVTHVIVRQVTPGMDTHASVSVFTFHLFI